MAAAVSQLALLGESKMAAPIIQGMPKSVDFSKLKFIDRKAAPPPRCACVRHRVGFLRHLGGGDDF
jgi:hypothetical protein